MILLAIVILSALPVVVCARLQESINQSIGEITAATVRGSVDGSVGPYEPISQNLPSEIHTPEILAKQPVGGALQSATGTVTVTGTLWYWDRWDVVKPMRDVLVYLVDYEYGERDDEIVAGCFTDYGGHFYFTVNNDDGPGEGGRDLYVLVHSENGAAYCKPLVWFFVERYVFKLQVGEDLPDGYVHNFGNQAPNEDNEAFEAIDACLEERDWVYSRTYWQIPKKIEVVYPTEDIAHAHGYSIHLPERLVNPPQSDWDSFVVYHEYAHCIMYTLYGHWPPGDIVRPHWPYNETNLGHAMNEGWAEFMQCVVHNVPAALWCTYDSHGGHIETNDFQNWLDTGDMDGDVIEGCVASIFWDMWDYRVGESESDHDFMCVPFNEIFDVLRDDQPDDIHQFWNSWSLRYPSLDDSMGPLCTIYWYHGIDKDTYAPYGEITIIGAPLLDVVTDYTNSAEMHLHVFARDWGQGVEFMRLAKSRTWSGPPDNEWIYSWEPWRPYDTPVKNWNYYDGDGIKYAFVQFKDYKGLVSQVYWDFIVLDTVKPAVSSVSVNPSQFPWKLILSKPGKAIWAYTGDHTHIEFSIDEPCHVEIRIYPGWTQIGSQIPIVKSMSIDAGSGLNIIEWNGYYGISRLRKVPSGFYKIEIIAKDRAGNVADPIVTSVTVRWHASAFG